jgi:hypothetical protein
MVKVRERKHLVFGAEELAVGGLSTLLLGKLVKVWRKCELGQKKKAGIPAGFFYVHIVADSVSAAMIAALKRTAQAMSPQPIIYEPASEEAIAARLRPFLGLPPLAVPQVSSVLHPNDYFKGEMLAALALAGESEVERARLEDELKELKDKQQKLDSRAEAAISAEFRHLAVIRRLRTRLRSTSLALSMSAGREEVRIRPAEFEEEWQSQCQALANAEAEVRTLREQLAKKTELKPAHPHLSGKIKSLEGQVADLVKLLEERASTIRALHEQCDALAAEATSAIEALSKMSKPKPKSKRHR